MSTQNQLADSVQPHETSTNEVVSAHADRYGGWSRSLTAIIAGALVGALLVLSLSVGVGYGVEGRNPPNWTFARWDEHWAWRAAASLASTWGAAFFAGMVARRRGRIVGAWTAVPTSLFWLAMIYYGWIATDTTSTISIGYRVSSIILVVASIPIAASAGVEGAPFGHANAAHFDSRRAALLGIRWYHYLWLPVLLHLMLLTGGWATVYSFGWLVASWRNGMSLFAIVPAVFLMAMLFTLQLLVKGASGTYQALAGFDDDSGQSVVRRVFKFGFGYTLATVLATTAIAFVHYGLATLIQKILG